MGSGEKVAPVKSIKLKVKFDKVKMDKNKKGIMKHALKKAKEEGKAHEATESKAEEDAEGTGGPFKKYVNLSKKGKGGMEQSQTGPINSWAGLKGRGGKNC